MRAFLAAVLALLAVAPAAHAVSTDAVIALQRGADRRITALDPDTLRPLVRGIAVRGNYAGGFAVSPDRRFFVVATNVPRGCELTVVRLRDFAVRKRFVVRGVEALGGDQVQWLRARRISVLTGDRYERVERVRFYDPLTGRENGERAAVPGAAESLRLAGRLFVLRSLLDAFDEAAQPVLAEFLGSGKAFAAAPLPNVRTPDSELSTDGRSLMADPRTGDPLVLAPTAGRIAALDPATGRRTDHAIRVPEGTSSFFTGPGSGSRLAIGTTGEDGSTRQLYTLDTRTWRTSKPWYLRGDAQPRSFGGLVLATSGFGDTPLRGVNAATVTGRPLWSAIPDHRVRAAVAIGPRVYADTATDGLTVLSARTGATLARRPTSRPDGLALLGSARMGLRDLESPAR